MSRASHFVRRPPSATATVAPPASRWIFDAKYAIVPAAIIWVLVVFMIVPEGFQYASSVVTVVQLPTSGSPLSRLIWLGILGGGAILVLWRGSLLLAMIRLINPFYLVFIALATASVLWSSNPSVTVRRLIRVFAVFFSCSAVVLVGWQRFRFQSVMRGVLTLMLFGSIVFGIVAPDMAITQSDKFELAGAWHGLALQKNAFGALASMGMIFWFHAWITHETKSATALVGGAIAGACLVLSRSSTSLLATVFTITFMLMLLRTPRNMRRFMPYLVGLFAAIILVYSLAVLKLVPGLDVVLTPVTAITGKDLTFSGRTAIWEIVNDHIRLHPLLGTGYGSYWLGETVPGSPAPEFLRRIYFYPGEAHNGYLDVVNDLGAVGAACLIGYVIAFLRQALRLMQIDRSQAALYLALVFKQFLGNLSESQWFSVMSLDFVIMSFATLALARGLLQAQLESLLGNPNNNRRTALSSGA